MMAANKPDLVAAAVAATPEEAEVIRAFLVARGIEAHVAGAAVTSWLPHLGLAIHPRGIRVMVLPQNLTAAKQALSEAEPVRYEGREIEEQQAAAADVSPDRYARSAYRAALLYLICPPILVLVPYFFCRALGACERRAVLDRRRFRRHMAVALIVGILIPWFCIIWLFGEVALRFAASVDYLNTVPISGE